MYNPNIANWLAIMDIILVSLSLIVAGIFLCKFCSLKSKLLMNPDYSLIDDL